MNNFRETFREVVGSETKGISVDPIWDKNEKRDIVIIPNQNDRGIELKLECYDYGIYPYIEGYSGSGACWDVTMWEAEDLKESLGEFLNSFLHDAVMEVFYSSGVPYKWNYTSTWEGKRTSSLQRRLFYNWFGELSVKLYSNSTNAT